MEVKEKKDIDLLQILGGIAPLSSDYQTRLEKQLVKENYKAKHLLLQPGEICRHIYFISSGLVRIYSMDELGKEKTHIFMGPGELAIDVSSFYEQTQATEYLETLRDTTIQSLTWNQLNAFYADFPEGNYVGRIITQKYLVKAVARNMELLTINALERYQSLLKNYPEIEQYTTLSHIASYLGITRETFSRMKSELIKNT